MEKKYNLRERLLVFSKRIIDIVNMLPRTPECDVIRKQLMGSGTSMGANFEEADVALTKKDFINKVGIARKEANETRYWLRVISGSYVEVQKVAGDIRETEEIINMFSSIIINSRK